jgi:hypothetical protein
MGILHSLEIIDEFLFSQWVLGCRPGTFKALNGTIVVERGTMFVLLPGKVAFFSFLLLELSVMISMIWFAVVKDLSWFVVIIPITMVVVIISIMMVILRSSHPHFDEVLSVELLRWSSIIWPFVFEMGFGFLRTVIKEACHSFCSCKHFVVVICGFVHIVAMIEDEFSFLARIVMMVIVVMVFVVIVVMVFVVIVAGGIVAGGIVAGGIMAGGTVVTVAGGTVFTLAALLSDPDSLSCSEEGKKSEFHNDILFEVSLVLFFKLYINFSLVK